MFFCFWFQSEKTENYGIVQPAGDCCDSVSSIVIELTETTVSDTSNGPKDQSPTKRPASPPLRTTPSKKLRLQLDAPPPNEPSSSQSTTIKQKSDPKKYIYGNYNRYYGYRNQSVTEDIRLTAFKQHLEFFDGQRVCDIGCNYGALTVAIARELNVQHMTGLDIDKELIALARKHLAEARKAFKSKNSTTEPAENNNRYEGFPFNVAFRQCNYVLEHDRLLDLVQEEFDTILCLSVTKWIQLNFGDAGLKLAFKRMYRQLKNGGRLILEAQPWKGYKRRKKLTPQIMQHYQAIKLFPNEFEEYLLSDEVGFSECVCLEVPSHVAKGFQRPIRVFVKGNKQITESQINCSG